MISEFIAWQFKKPSGLFGKISAVIMAKNNRKAYLRIIQELDLQPQDRLLEIGYGPGVGIKMIAEQCSTCTIDGIDFSKLMYNKASRYNQDHLQSGRVHLIEGDFLEVQVMNSYDKIYCLNVVYFWNELRRPFEKAYSLLKKGGSFHIYMLDDVALLEKNAPVNVFNKYTIAQVTDTLQSVGFSHVNQHGQSAHYIKAVK